MWETQNWHADVCPSCLAGCHNQPRQSLVSISWRKGKVMHIFLLINKNKNENHHWCIFINACTMVYTYAGAEKLLVLFSFFFFFEMINNYSVIISNEVTMHFRSNVQFSIFCWVSHSDADSAPFPESGDKYVFIQCALPHHFFFEKDFKLEQKSNTWNVAIVKHFSMLKKT